MSNPIQAVWIAVKAIANFVLGETIKVATTEGFKVMVTTAAKAALQQAARAALIMAVAKAVMPSRKVADPGANTRFSANPYAPRPLVFGRTGFSGHPVMATVHGTGNNKNAYLTYIVALSAFGPIQSIESLALSGQTQNFVNNVSVGGNWAGKVFHQTKTGAWSQAAIVAQGAEAADRAIAAWDAFHKGSGVAHAMLTYKYDADKFGGGAPTPIWTLQGSNLCVRPDTLEVGYSDYPPDIVFTLMKGIVDPITGVMVGAGMDADQEIDRASLSAWRAVCVANNWRCGGVYHVDNENLVDVIKEIMAAGSARITDINGKVGVEFDAPGVATYTITENDLSDFPTEAAMVDRRSYFTSGIPRFHSEPDGWDLIEAAEVSNSEWLADATKARVDTQDHNWVNNAQQARQLTGYALANMKQATYDLPVRKHCSGLVPGTRLSIDLPDFGISETCVKVLANSATPREGGILRVRVDALAVHSWALGITGDYTPPAYATQPSVTDVPIPIAGDWSVIATTLSQGGTQLPAIKATVNVNAPVVARAEVQIKPAGSSDWVDTGIIDRAQSSTEFRGLTPDTSYAVRVRYVSVSGAPSAWVSLPAVLTSAFVAGASVDGSAAADAIAAINNQNMLTKDKKPQVVQDWNTVQTEYTTSNWVSTATSLGITTEVTNYQNAYIALSNYLNTLTVAGGAANNWYDVSVNSAITRTTWNTKWQDYDAAKLALQAKINAVQKNNGDITNGSLVKNYTPHPTVKTWTQYGVANDTTANAIDVYSPINANGIDWIGIGDQFAQKCMWPVNDATIYEVTTICEVVSLGTQAPFILPGGFTFKGDETPSGSSNWEWGSNWERVAVGTYKIKSHYGKTAIGGSWSVIDGILTYSGVIGLPNATTTELVRFGLLIFDGIGTCHIQIKSITVEDVTNLSNIWSDNKLSRGEKPAEITKWATAHGEYSGLVATATSLGVTTELSAYTTAYTNLSNYLSSTIPTWNNTAVDTDIIGTTYRNNWSTFEAARTALVNKKGALSQLTTVDTGNIAAGAVTQSEQTTLSGLYYATTSWQDLQTKSITTTGEEVQLAVSGHTIVDTNTDLGSGLINIRVLRDATEIYPETTVNYAYLSPPDGFSPMIPPSTSSYQSFTFLLGDTPSAGSHTYKIQFKRVGGTTTSRASNGYIRATKLKR